MPRLNPHLQATPKTFRFSIARENPVADFGPVKCDSGFKAYFGAYVKGWVEQIRVRTVTTERSGGAAGPLRYTMYKR